MTHGEILKQHLTEEEYERWVINADNTDKRLGNKIRFVDETDLTEPLRILMSSIHFAITNEHIKYWLDVSNKLPKLIK